MIFYTRVFCRFLQVMFSINDPGQYKWLDDEQNTEIFIGDVDALDREVLEKRPAILVKRGAFKLGTLSFNQFMGRDPNNPAIKRFADLNAGMVTFRCIAKRDTEASRIAWNAVMALRRTKAALQRAARIHRVAEDIDITEPTEPGALIMPESKNETSLVSVFVPFFYRDAWSTQPADKLLLKRIDIALTSELNYPAPGATAVIRGPGWNGQELEFTKKISLTTRVSVSGAKNPKPRR